MKLENLTFKGGVNVPHYKEMTENLSHRESKRTSYGHNPIAPTYWSTLWTIGKSRDTVKVGEKLDNLKFLYLHQFIHQYLVQLKVLLLWLSLQVLPLIVVIESDGKNELHESVQPKGNLEDLSSKEIISIIKDAGITGMGGASFPTHVKLSPPKKIDTILINGAECEPYLTADHRIMIEEPKNYIWFKSYYEGCRSWKRNYWNRENKPDAIIALREASKDEKYYVVSLKVKYPQGDEKG